jgi:hypothetical protein
MALFCPQIELDVASVASGLKLVRDLPKLVIDVED